MAYSTFEKDFFRANGRLPTAAEIGRGSLVARADSELIETIITDPLTNNLHHREFHYAKKDAWKSWMDDFRAVAQRQVFINKDARPADWCEARAARMLADERATAQQIREHGIESLFAHIEI